MKVSKELELGCTSDKERIASSATPREFTVEHRYTDLDDVRLHHVEAGEGPLALLLHAFPEFWYSWRFQIPALVKAGFHVVAPEDMRGYNLSDKPQGVRDYRIGLLGQDVVRAIRACGEERAAVVGHEWGVAVAWMAAMRHPEQVEKLAILNVPHPERFLRGLRSLRQPRKSWYACSSSRSPGYLRWRCGRVTSPPYTCHLPQRSCAARGV